MDTIRLALIPLRTRPRAPQVNRQEVARRLAQVAAARPHLVCLPECTLTGYLYTETDLARFAEPIPGPTTQAMAALARQHGVFLCFGLLERAPEGVYNTALLLDDRGEIRLKHRKIHEQPPFCTGDAVRVADTPLGRLGILICGDLFAPQAIRYLDSDLDLLLVPMARAFDRRSPDAARWEREERAAYLDAVRAAGVPAAIVNALEVLETEPSFGGALLVGPQGDLLAEAPHGTDQALIHTLQPLRRP